VSGDFILLAIKLKARCMATSVFLASSEVKIHLRSTESSEPIDVEQRELRKTNSLVEECVSGSTL
jgi:exosome complex exonuclease DIS3/RRP44